MEAKGETNGAGVVVTPDNPLFDLNRAKEEVPSVEGPISESNQHGFESKWAFERLAIA